MEQIQPKKFLSVLIQVYGINFFRAKYIFSIFGLSLKIHLKDIPIYLVEDIFKFIFKNFYIGKQLKFIENKNFKKLSLIKNYKNFRHFSNLPVRGQRTHSNAKTQRRLKCRLISKNN